MSSSEVRVNAVLGAVSKLRSLPSNKGIIVIWGVSLPLIFLGSLMVTSATATQAQGAFLTGGKHIIYALLAVTVMVFIANFVTPKMLKRHAFRFFLAVLFLQMLVLTPLGTSVGGNRNWLTLGPVTVQPSEFLKLAMILLIALQISNRRSYALTLKEELLPPLVIAGAAIVLIIGGRDQGTASILGLALLGCLFFTGTRMRRILLIAGAGATVAMLGVITSPNRLARFKNVFASGSADDYAAIDWQPTHAIWAIANGGVTGTGIGNSLVKWAWLPASENDYIFAIIAEELGMIGAVCVIIGYCVMAWALVWVMGTLKDNFGRAVVGGVLVWIIGQAVINIAVVLRFLPVLGVPLPLVSAGGSALLACAAALGVVISIAHDAEGKNRAAEQQLAARSMAQTGNFMPFSRGTGRLSR